MKKKLIQIFICVYAVLLVFGSMGVFAVEPYTTYTYSNTGAVLQSPHAYSAQLMVDSAYMRANAKCQDFEDIANPTDLFAAADGRVYIVDQKNNQVVVLNEYYKAIYCLSVFDSEYMNDDTFNQPTGVYVNDEFIYVCDTRNSRIVKFDAQSYECMAVIEKPTSPILEENALFLPIAMAVDPYNRLFVVSESNYEGVIVMDENSVFTGYIGAPKVTSSLIDIIWRQFQSEEQRANNISYIPTQFQNITVDDEGFIYVTSSTIDEDKQLSNITATSQKSDYSPVRKLNSAGAEIMKRNGFFNCTGEVVTMVDRIGVSKIEDVAIGPEGSWSIIDSRRSKVYTYNSNGELLFVFGDSGSQLGNITSLEGITYQGDNMLLLDYNACAFTVYTRTEYGNKLVEALANDNARLYDRSIYCWQDVLQYNNNFDAAYIGVGKALYLSGEYDEAMEYLKSAYETSYYSKAYSEVRKAWISKFFVLIPVLAVAAIYGLIKWFKYAAKVNHRATYKSGAKRTYWEELLYAFHIIFHPFDGFYDLKHEKRGSVRAATTILGMNVLAFYYMSVGRGYLANPTGAYSRLFVQVLSIFLPVLLFAVGNWCLTTLFDGEGSFKHIYVAVGYALSPVPPFLIFSTIMSNFIGETGVQMITFINVLSFVWAGLLLFFGVLVTHDYTMGKNFLTLLATVLSMCVIMFAVILFSNLVSKMVMFVSSIVTEISFRM